MLRQSFSKLNRMVTLKYSRRCLTTEKTVEVEKRADEKRGEVGTPKKPIKNEPFIKKLFTGVYEKDYLRFPECTGEEVKEIEAFVQPMENYFLQEARGNDKVEDFRENFDKLVEFQCFSLTAPREFGGLETESMKFARILEAMATKPGLCIQLIVHNELLLKSLYIYGSPEQKAKYMPSLSNGTLKGAFCFSEPHTGVDAAKLKVDARIDAGSNKIYLNGRKSWVTMSGDLKSDENVLLVVIAKVPKFESNEDNFDIAAFLVEKSEVGEGELKFNKQLDLTNGVALYEIEFNNVCVPLDKAQLSSSLDTGYQMTTHLYENSRHLVGAVCTGLLKNLYQTTIEHAINNTQFERSICNFQMVKERLCKIESTIYAMESMTYLTAGIVDSFEIPDVSVEGALTKIYCTEALKKAVDDCIHILAMSSYTKLNEIQSTYLKAINHLLLFLNTNDVLRHYVAFHGASTAAIANAEKLRKIKDVFNHPMFGLKVYMENVKKKKLLEKGKPGLYFLWEDLHPSLQPSAATLEKAAASLNPAIEWAFMEQGTEIIDYQLNMKRLANMSLEIFLMNACLARASRAYSIGLHNCDFEFYLANINVHFAKKRFDMHHNEIFTSTNGTNVDNLIINVADRALKQKQHTTRHALSRTFD